MHTAAAAQVDEWHPGLVAIEATAKLNASVILFVVGAETRGVASMVEVSDTCRLLRCAHGKGPYRT